VLLEPDPAEHRVEICLEILEADQVITVVDVLRKDVHVGHAIVAAEELGEDGEGVIVTQVVPHYDADLPIVSDFRKALQNTDKTLTPSFGALEGYICSRILIHALKTIDGILTREKIIDALEKLGRFDIGLGFSLEISPSEHQASHQVWPTIIKNGNIIPFNWQDLSKK